MQRTASINVRIDPTTRQRLDRLAEALNRPRSYIVESALAAYLEVNEWQIQAIRSAVAEADSPSAEWMDHDDVMAEWKAKLEDPLE